MVDDYGGETGTLNAHAAKFGVMAPASGHETVTGTTSAVTLIHTSRALWINTGGVVSVNMAASTANPASFTVPDATLLPIRVTGFTTLTTASGIVSLY